MAFRVEILAFACVAALAQPLSFEVRHEHFPKPGTGTLSIGDTGISYNEPKKMSHSRSWVWESIQQLTLERGAIRILTYEDSKLELGRDREFNFTALPPDLAGQVLIALRTHLGSRLVAAIADNGNNRDFELAAKLLQGRKGSQGVLRFAPGMISFDTESAHSSRLWMPDDIETITHPAPDELSITVRERTGLRRLANKEYRFQLKEPMPEARYQALWRSLNSLRIGPPPAAPAGGISMPGHSPASTEKKP